MLATSAEAELTRCRRLHQPHPSSQQLHTEPIIILLAMDTCACALSVVGANQRHFTSRLWFDMYYMQHVRQISQPIIHAINCFGRHTLIFRQRKAAFVSCYSLFVACCLFLEKS